MFDSFFKPNVEKLKAKRDVKGLIKALGYRNQKDFRDFDVRKKAASALGELKDARAVEPLITVLLNDNAFVVCESAARALGRLKDTRSIEPLITALKHDYVGEAAASALGSLKNACAIEPLVAALKDSKGERARKAAANALDRFSWKPGQDESGAAYWAAKQEWDKCIEIGAPAVDPLIAMLKEHSKAAAMTLVRLYHQNNIDVQTKQKILAQRKVITERSHVDIPACMEPHADRMAGIDVDFPL